MTDEIKMPEGFYCASDFPQATPIDQVAWGTGWNSFDEIFKMYPGQFTVVTGIAGHGKSTFLLNVITRIALLESKRSFLYVPENERHVVSILKRIWPSTEMSLQYFLDAQCWIQSQSHQYKQQPYQTLDWVLECAIHAVKHCGVQVLMIDPWNELERLCPRHMLMSDYIGQCLMMLKSFARTFEVSIFLVAHPTKSVNDKGGLRIPTLADIEGCYADDTEVLTRRGWMHHGQLTMSDDVACFDPNTSAVQYHQPERIIRKEYSGAMHHFKGLGYDLLVTPGHRMIIKPKWEEPVGSKNGRGRPIRFEKGKWDFVEACNIPGSQFVIPLAGGSVDGADPSTITIADKTYPAEAFWRLVGWYVAEGHFGITGLTWAQAEGQLALAFTEAFAEAGIPATVGWQQPYGKGRKAIGRWYIGNRFCPQLVSWFGNECGRGAINKQIPDAVFELSPRLKRVFLRAYLEGDGSITGDGFTASTISSRLRDDLQRLAVELGIPTSSSEFAPSGKGRHRIHIISFGRDCRREVTMRTQRNMKIESYSGLVWCLTVPTGAYFVRRNGRVTVCGNSMNWFNKCDNGLVIHREEKSTCVISAKIREIGAGVRGAVWFNVETETGKYKPVEAPYVPL
jgi:LAGLIDADG-like domain